MRETMRKGRIKLLLALTGGVLAAGTLMAPQAVAASAAPDASSSLDRPSQNRFPGTFYLNPVHAPNMCVTAHGGVRKGALVDSYKCVGQENQRWYITTLEDLAGLPVYRVQAAGNAELCAQLPNGNGGTQVRVTECGADKGAQWMIACGVNLKRCIFRNVDASTGEALSVRGGSNANNTPVIIWPMNGAKDQEFNLQPA